MAKKPRGSLKVKVRLQIETKEGGHFTGSPDMPSPEETVKAFVKVAPAATYAFDGDRDANSAKLCRRRPGGGEDCIQVAMAAKKLSATMQDMGFFCQLPFDPTQTHIECVHIPK